MHLWQAFVSLPSSVFSFFLLLLLRWTVSSPWPTFDSLARGQTEQVVCVETHHQFYWHKSHARHSEEQLEMTGAVARKKKKSQKQKKSK